MKYTSKLLTTALVASTMLAAPALAGSLTKPLDSAMDAGAAAGAGVGIGADVSGKAGNTGAKAGANADVETTGSINADAGNQGDVVSSIRGNGATAADIDAMADVSEVEVVRVAPPTEEAGKAIDNAMQQNEAALDELRQALEGNASVKDKLSQAGVDPRTVVAARTAADGTLTVYVR